MNVTIENFEEILSEFESSLPSIDFISIDTEFSGLNSDEKSHELLDPQQYYCKSKKNIEKFQILQVGLSLFKRIENDRFDCSSYNFYIFPSKHFSSQKFRERYFLCQSSSLKFLIENGFDFNKVIREGISYLPLSEKAKSKENIEKCLTKSRERLYETDDDDEDFRLLKTKIVEFIRSDQNEIVFADCMKYSRRVQYHYQNTFFVSPGKGEKAGSLILTKNPSSCDGSKMLIEALGFSLIIELLIKYQKPIVGHHLFYDLMHIYHSFIEDLPVHYSEWRRNLKICFPIIYDTKYITDLPSIKNYLPSFALENIFHIVKSEPFLKTEINLKNQSTKEYEFHDAGYDSYITGCCFINLIRFYFSAKIDEQITNILSKELLEQFQNKIAIHGIYDIRFLDLEKDPVIDRSNVFYARFPSSYTRNNLQSIFNPFGGIDRICWIDDQSAFLILKDAKKRPEVIESLIQNAKPNSQFKLQYYTEFLKESNQNNHQADEQNSKESANGKAEIRTNSLKKTCNFNEEDQSTLHAVKKIKITSPDSDRSKMDINKLFEDNQEW
ncbi:Methionine aminopeptidase 1D [Sarcoptes scabiei]|nr:Methionine aminopeptidase 1D [Sarcoptes scabiei]